MRRKRFEIAALVLVLALLPARHVAWAATVTVNSTTDASDGDTSSIANLIASPGLDGVISLREAMEAANNTPGSDTINFDIPGCGGVCTIQPTKALPPLTDDGTTIDGYSQPGAAEATDGTPATLLIEINGASVASNNGFDILSAGNVIRGLVINRFSQNGVVIHGSGATGNTVCGNYIGTDANGTAGLGNGGAGIRISAGAQNNTTGGDTEGERNVISGNDSSGVQIYGSGTMSNTVSGNYIGTAANGAADLGNGWDGVYIEGGAQNNTIGGDTEGERNVISGNDGYGVRIYGSTATGNVVRGNYIGTAASGTDVLGNTCAGVYIRSNAQNNTIGPGNVIAHNSGDGVEVDGGGTSGNTITQNSILSNTMGIDLVSGANEGIAAPVIITTTQGSVNVVGSACPGCTVEVFMNDDSDGEGETYVGDTTATAGGAFTVTVSYLIAPYLTATATDAISGTSEFSEVFIATVQGAPPPTMTYLPFISKSP